jgi:hypothetical protein
LTNEQPDHTDSREVIPPNNNDSNNIPATGSNPSAPDDGGGTVELVAVAAVAELADLAARVSRLETMLAHIRRVYADLVAACRAALTAAADGEPDPLSYVRDELPAAPEGHPLAKDSKRAGGGR